MVFLTAVSTSDQPASYKITYGNQIIVLEEQEKRWYNEEEFFIYSAVSIILCPFICLCIFAACTGMQTWIRDNKMNRVQVMSD